MEILLDHDTQRRLEELAKTMARPQGEIAAQLLKNCLTDLQRWQLDAIHKGLEDAEAGRLTDIDAVRIFWEEKRAHLTDAKR